MIIKCFKAHDENFDLRDKNILKDAQKTFVFIKNIVKIYNILLGHSEDIVHH